MSSAEVRAFGREVERRRTLQGLTLVDLETRSRLAPANVAIVESGERPLGPSMDVAFKLAKGLDAHLADLVGGSGKLSGLSLEAGRLIEAVPTRLRAPTLALFRAVTAKGGAP